MSDKPLDIPSHSNYFEARQKRLIKYSSKEFKEWGEQVRKEIEQEYKESTSWYESDNDARSPLEADWSDIDD